MKTILIIPSLLLLIGCSSPSTGPTSDDTPVRYASHVQVAVADTTPRSATSKIGILRDAPKEKHHVIALLTIDGDAQLEGKLINAMAWKARQLGADAIIIQTPLHAHTKQWIFRVDAIVMDTEK